LREFQRLTVERAAASLFAGAGTGRFLVADEVGLGKTRVAAALIRRLESARRRKPSVVVYFAPNVDVAHQNLRVLRPRAGAIETSQRLTLLAEKAALLESPGVHVLGFTPGTSLDVRRGTGTARERALLMTLLAPIWGFRQTDSVIDIFRDRAKRETLRNATKRIERGVSDTRVARAFAQILRDRADLLRTFTELRALARDGELEPKPSRRRRQLIGELREILAHASLRGLNAKLVILDEFHRYPEVLRSADEPGTLGRELLGKAPTLLLSATPYRMHADEMSSDTHLELRQLLGFLLGDEAAAAAEGELTELRSSFRRLRPSGDTQHEESVARARKAKQQVELRLAPVMSRWQRPTDNQRTEIRRLVPKADDVAAYLAFQGAVDVAAASVKLHHRQTVEYWKSAPYLMSFMRGYAINSAIDKARREHPDSRAPMRRALRRSVGTVLALEKVKRYQPVARTNARFRELERLALDDEQWRALWVPPALCPYSPAGKFARVAVASATKTLVFSAWRVVPTAVAALAGYEAERRSGSAANELNGKTDRQRRTGAQLLALRQRPGGGRDSAPQGMALLALVYPSLALTERVDPFELARRGAGVPSSRQVVHRARGLLGPSLRSLRDLEHGRRHDPRWYWAAPMLLDAALGIDVRSLLREPGALRRAWRGRGEQRAGSEALLAGLLLAERVVSGATELGKMPEDLRDVLAKVAVAGPAVAALRTMLTKGYGPDAQLAAARIGWGMRTLLNRADATLVIRAGGRSRRGGRGYWRQVLDYCVDGALQGVIDEYLHLLIDEHRRPELSDAQLAINVADAFCTATDLQPLAIRADRPRLGTTEARPERWWLTSRFAVAFGAAQTEDETAIHPDHMRQAFNSPFWPWVLISTSVGQEGLDFHRYCHQVVHWNVPATPVELEQREGRVLRYLNHAVRRNIARHHGADALRERDRWSALLAAAQNRVRKDPRLGHHGFAPEWHYRPDGADQVVRRIAPVLSYSRDDSQFMRVEKARVYYRLVLGQPNPEELVEAVIAAIPFSDAERLLNDNVVLDLTPKLAAGIAAPSLTDTT
jgi:hypothetical protein